MKTTNISNKENDYSLHNLDNYHKNFNCDIQQILYKYVYLINEFLTFILEKTKIKWTDLFLLLASTLYHINYINLFLVCI